VESDGSSESLLTSRSIIATTDTKSDGVHMCCSASSVLVQYSRSVIAPADKRNDQFGFHTELVGSRSSPNKGIQVSIRSTGLSRCICYLLTLPEPEHRNEFDLQQIQQESGIHP